MGIIAMMEEDRVWPTSFVDLTEEEEDGVKEGR